MEKYPWRYDSIVESHLGLEGGRFLFPSEELDGSWRYTTRQWLGEGPKYKHDGPPYMEIYWPTDTRNDGDLWICEGHPDTVTAHSLGYNAIGMVGTSTVSNVLPYVKGRDRVTLVMDADPAGWGATKSLYNALLETDTEPLVALLIPAELRQKFLQHWGTMMFSHEYTALGLDLSSFVQKYGPTAARYALENPVKGTPLKVLKNQPKPERTTRVGSTIDFTTLVRGLTCGRACPCRAVERRGVGVSHCPAHPDSTPSLSIKQQGVKVLVHCFGGCDQDAVVNALKDRDLWRTSEPIPSTSSTGGGASSYLSRAGDSGGSPSQSRLSEAGRLPRAGEPQSLRSGAWYLGRRW